MSVIVFVLTLDEIDGVSQIMPQVKKEWADRLIFVDGGSTDGTVEKAKELGFEVIHQKNKGEGNACRVGTDATDSDYVMFFSPDGNDVPEDILRLIQKSKEGHDVVHISRFGKNSQSDDANMLEYFGNKMFTFLVNVFFGGHWTDVLNENRIISRKAFNELKFDALGLSSTQQMCIRGLKIGQKICEVIGNEGERIGGTRKMHPLSTGASLSWQIIKEFIFWKT